MSTWARSLEIALPQNTAHNPARATAAAVAKAAPPATVKPPAPAPAPARVASATNLAPLPPGTPLHLRIIYTPWAPQEARAVASLAARVSGDVPDIATAQAAAGPVTAETVAYFFADDRAGAASVATSLARVTRHAEPVRLLHAKPLPRPGTVEILLPVNTGKDLTP
jgi:hypothetical protein